MIEIRDGLLALSPYRLSGLKEAVNAAAEREGLTGRDRAAAVEAALIALALDAYRKRVPAEMREESTSLGEDAADLTGEASWLARVAEAMPSALRLQGWVHA
ncbi:hypothetical protein GCM10010439_47270 [Actinocorallia aurantiaca]|uniref:DUF6545 domain-containing protein n=1 Tax=Actinocorallia aurantiaca TaxID=46204 RepID=A0ABP6GUI6_9ACTN